MSISKCILHYLLNMDPSRRQNKKIVRNCTTNSLQNFKDKISRVLL